MLASLSKLVGGGFTFPYKFDQDQGEASWGRWTHYRGTANDDGAAVSVFKITCPLSETEVIEAAKNGVKRLRTVRHPNILAFKDTAEQEDRQSMTIYLVTEPVSMLPNVLGELQLQGEERAEYFSVGLRQAATAVAFLNNDCKLIHGNVCRSSVVVTDTLDWKLAFLDLLTEHAAAGTGQLASAALLVAPQYLPGEVGKQSWAAVASGPPWAVDAWGLGCLMQEVWTGEPLLGMEALRNTACVPEAIRSEYQRLLASTPSKRINTAKVASCDGLRNSMVELVEFMDNLAVKDSLEKEKFFKRLPSRIEHIPDKVATQKLLPMVADALQFGGAPAVALAPLLELGKKLDEEQFTARVVPTISRLFTSNDRSIRRSLLEALPQYSSALTPKVVEEQIYTPLSAGFSEQHAYLRELTLKCMLQLAPKLSQRTLNQSLLKHLARLQVDEEPSIRANTTILLGNIAQYLGETACKRILLNAFTRALKDQFPPSRVAALRALVATQQYYGMDEIATRLLPAASPLAIEPLQDVRTAALACIDASLASLKQHSRRLDAAGDAGGGAGAGASASSLGAGAGGDKGGTIAGQASSMLNWAVSSIMSAPAAGTASAAPAAARPRTTGPSTSAPAAARQPSQSPTHAPARHGGADADGWGDDDDEEFEAMDDEELAARQRLSRAAGPKPGAPANPANRGLKQMQDAVEDAGTGWDGDDTDGWGNLDDLRPAAADTQLDMPSSRRRTAGDESSARKLPSASVKARKPMKLGATRIAKDA